VLLVELEDDAISLSRAWYKHPKVLAPVLRTRIGLHRHRESAILSGNKVGAAGLLEALVRKASHVGPLRLLGVCAPTTDETGAVAPVSSDLQAFDQGSMSPKERVRTSVPGGC
jgi:hypothetical protein